jgi:maltooligosyltrehalose trehalohydrolase
MSPVAEPLHAKPQGARQTAAGTVCWSVWAPRHSVVRLALFTGSDRRIVPMAPDQDGYFTCELAGIASGTRYAYLLGALAEEFPDPASRWQPNGVHQPSALFFPEEYVWHDEAWRGLSMRDLVIYELHVGSFTQEGTFAAVVPRLAELKELGVTAIEIMPVSQFPGQRNWGYDGVHPYAAQNSYGGPQGLLELVDAAHTIGLGVILDVVYNHLGPEGNYLGQFGPYFTTTYHTPWGAAINYDGPQSDPVRRFAIDNACQWIRDFHIDGLRLDAVQTVFDQSPYPLLAELQAEVQQTAAAEGRTAVVIAETNQNDARLTAPAASRGYGLDGVWNDDFHHSIHALLTGELDGYYVDYGAPEKLAKAYRDAFIYDGCYSSFFRRRQGSRVHDQPRERFVVCIQNHDQIGNRALGDRLATLVSPSAQRLAAALLLISPFTPLLFMGEEYGETNPFAFFCSFGDPVLVEAVRQGRKREFAELDFHWSSRIPDPDAPSTLEQAILTWQWEDDSHRRGLRQLYQTLLAARRTWPPLIDREHCTARVIGDDVDQQTLVVQRGPEFTLLAAANLESEPIPLDATVAGDRQPLLSTAEARFGGQRTSLHALDRLLPYELVIWGTAAWM